jgi:hypothetical protein
VSESKIPHPTTLPSNQILLNHQTCLNHQMKLESFLHFKPFKITQN